MFTIGASSQYKMYSISEVFCSIEKLYTMYIHTNRHASSVGHSWSGFIAMYKVNDLEFQGHAIEIENFNYTIGFLDPETILMKNSQKKFGREDKNPGGLQQPPSWLQTLIEIAWLYAG